MKKVEIKKSCGTKNNFWDKAMFRGLDRFIHLKIHKQAKETILDGGVYSCDASRTLVTIAAVARLLPQSDAFHKNQKNHPV